MTGCGDQECFILYISYCNFINVLLYSSMYQGVSSTRVCGDQEMVGADGGREGGGGGG
jgi:hypothetical protein